MNARAADASASNGARSSSPTPPPAPAQTSGDKRAEADRRVAAAFKRILSVESNRKLLIELAKR